MRVSGAWEMMQSNGFKCGERAATTFDAKARKLGVATPLTERLITLIADLEAGRRVMAWDNLEELVRLSG